MDKNAKKIIDDYLLNNIEKKWISGCSLAIAQGEDIIYNENFGYANVEKKYPITNHTVFRMASNTKVVTAIAALICHEKGLFSIYDTVDKYIPWFKDFYVRDLEGNVIDNTPFKIQIKQILNHSSGFACGPLESKEFDALTMEQKATLESMVEACRNFSLSFRPDENKFNYSAVTAYDVLARVIEIVSGLSYYEFLKKYLFDLLGMTHTAFVYDNVKEEDHAISYRSVDGRLEYVDDENKSFDTFPAGHQGGGASLLSCQDDYLKFAIMITQHGIYKGVRILKPETIALLTEGTLLTTPWNTQDMWGLGVYIRTSGRILPAGSFGWSGAFGTHYFSVPKYNLTVVYLHNSMTYGGAGAVTADGVEAKIVEALKLE